MKEQQKTFLVAASVVLIGGIFVFARSTGLGEPSPSTGEPVTRAGEVQPLRPESSESRRLVATASSDSVRFRVVAAATGAPLSREVVALAGTRRSWSRSSLKSVGWTDSNGVLWVAGADLQTTGAGGARYAVVTRSTLQPFMSEGDGELLCRVAENHRVVIRCVVENREPLEGVRFALSRTAVPFEHPTFGAEDVTLADNHAGAHAMFVGQTDAGGMLVLDGLPAGSYPFDIEAEGHVCVAGPDPDEETLAVPSGALEFVFRRVHVALAKLSGGAVVASSQSSPGTLDTTGARSSRELRRIRMSLQQSHPDCFLHLVGVPRASLASDYRATANVLLRHGGALGWKAVHVPFVPFRSELQPVVIDPAGMTIAAVGQLTVTLRTPGGTAIRGAEFSLQELEGGRSHPPLWPSTGDELSVPAGEYQLRFSDRALRRDVGPQRVVVTAGNETTVPLATTTEMKPYRIRLRAVEGDPAWGGVTIVVTPEGGRPRVFGGDSLVSTRVLWAPAGSLRVQVMAGGYAPIDRGVDLAADCPSGVHEIDLILSPDQPLASTR